MNSTNLQLTPNNPYSIGTLFVHFDGELNLDAGDLNYVPSSDDRYFTLVDGDDLTKVAFLAYGDSKLYWVLAMANEILNPLDVPPNTTIVIPNLKTLNIL